MNTRLICIISLVLALSLVGNVQAQTATWTDADPGDHLWSTPENWDAGLPDSADWAKIRNGPPGATVANAGAVALKVHIGYEEGSALTVDGGILTTVEDVLLGKNGGSGTLNMISGVINCGRDLEVGGGDPGLINMTGGHIDVGDDFMIPEDITSTAEVHLDGGTIYVEGTFEMRADDGTMNGSMDITFGTLTIDHDVTALVQGHIDSGWITGFGVVGNVTLEVVNDDTVVTATADPLQRTPAYGAEVNTVGDSNVDLSWANLDPNNPNDGVWVDVWFGTDVDALTLEVDAELNTTGVTVSAPGNNQEYFWRIDTYRYGNPALVDYENDPNFVVDEGILMVFTVVNDAPPTIVINTPRTVTWVNEPFLVEATVTDDGTSEVTVTWDTSINSDPNEEYSDPVIVLPAGTTYPVVVSTYLTVDFDKGSFAMRANAADSAGDNWSEEVHHQCRADACAAAIFWWQRDGGGVPQGELNADCAIDLGDLLLLVNEWLDDYTILVPTEIPQ